ncbi:hypothetical protein IWZ01DRAFT_556697 [Phyllosticta capitalensis]
MFSASSRSYLEAEESLIPRLPLVAFFQSVCDWVSTLWYGTSTTIVEQEGKEKEKEECAKIRRGSLEVVDAIPSHATPASKLRYPNRKSITTPVFNTSHRSAQSTIPRQTDGQTDNETLAPTSTATAASTTPTSSSSSTIAAAAAAATSSSTVMMMSASESAVMVVVMAVMATAYVHGRGANVSGAGEVASSAVSSPAAVLVSRCCVAAAVGPRGPGWSAAHFGGWSGFF